MAHPCRVMVGMAVQYSVDDRNLSSVTDIVGTMDAEISGILFLASDEMDRSPRVSGRQMGR